MGGNQTWCHQKAPEAMGTNTIIHNVSFAPQRHDSDFSPLAAFACTVVATTIYVNTKAGDPSLTAKDRDTYLESSKYCTGIYWMALGLLADWFFYGRFMLLVPRDVKMPFAGSMWRFFQAWLDVTTKQFLEGAIITGEFSSGTYFGKVLKQLRTSRVFWAGKTLNVLGLPAQPHRELVDVMKAFKRICNMSQNVMKTTLDEHLFSNFVQCFDVPTWAVFLKDDDQCEGQARQYADRMLRLYQSLCRAKGWQHLPGLFQEWM